MEGIKLSLLFLFRGHISKGQMVELTADQVVALPKSTVISRLRFIPKTDGMRPITRVTGADAKTRVHFVSCNIFISTSCYPFTFMASFSLQLYQSHIRDLLDMLQACVRSTPSFLGSTVWGMADIHKVLSSMAPAQKEKPQPLYFVKVCNFTFEFLLSLIYCSSVQ